VQNRNLMPHRPQTTLTSAQEAVSIVLRKTLQLSIDDCGRW
jgi:hypothetical protein